MPLREAMNRLLEESFVWPGRLEVFTGRSFPVDVYESKDQKEDVAQTEVWLFLSKSRLHRPTKKQ